MLYMKEDDIDEMMRKAAENYEVDADKAADWNAVYNAVHSQNESQTVDEKKRKRRFVFWWLLLIPLGWIANTEYNKFYTAYKKEEIKPSAFVQSKQSQQQSSSKKLLPVNDQQEKNTSTENNSSNRIHLYKKTTISYNNQQLNSNSSITGNYSLLQQQAQVKAEQKTLPQPEQMNFNNANTIKNDTTSAADHLTDEQRNISKALNSDTAIKQNNIGKAKPLIKKQKSNTHYFYAGLAAGTDLSFIKYQNVQPLGYNLGLMGGYKFNKLSIETGVFFVKKNYYTQGEYFDKSSIAYFDDAKILSIDGYCRMFEIPLNVKYDISEKKKHTWFATAGLSSYLINKEYYHYDYIKNGMEHNGSYPYYHTTQNWFSVLNLSAGYQLKTGVKTNLRIEPYFKTTLSGVGKGNLSISSAGVNLGIIRRIP